MQLTTEQFLDEQLTNFWSTAFRKPLILLKHNGKDWPVIFWSPIFFFFNAFVSKQIFRAEHVKTHVAGTLKNKSLFHLPLREKIKNFQEKKAEDSLCLAIAQSLEALSEFDLPFFFSFSHARDRIYVISQCPN